MTWSITATPTSCVRPRPWGITSSLEYTQTVRTFTCHHAHWVSHLQVPLQQKPSPGFFTRNMLKYITQAEATCTRVYLKRYFSLLFRHSSARTPICRFYRHWFHLKQSPFMLSTSRVFREKMHFWLVSFVWRQRATVISVHELNLFLSKGRHSQNNAAGFDLAPRTTFLYVYTHCSIISRNKVVIICYEETHTLLKCPICRGYIGVNWGYIATCS